MLIVNIIVTIAIIFAVFASIAAWSNTQIILKELSEIKSKLGIKEERKTSFLDRDLDND